MTRPYRPHMPLILLASLLIGLALAYLWLHLVTPFDNGRLEPRSSNITAEGIVVLPVPGGPAGFLAGDLVTAVDGHSLTDEATQIDWAVGDTVFYEVVRGGRPLIVQVTLEPYPLGSIVRQNWGTIAFALVYLPIAAYVFLRRPELPAARVLFLSGAALFCATTWSLGAQVSDFVDGSSIWLFFLTIIPGFMLIWISSFHFALVFPQPLPLLARARWLLPLAYGLPYLLLAIYLILTRQTAVNTLDWLSRWGVAADVTAIVYLLPTLATVVWQYRVHKTAVARQKIRWLVLAAVLVGGVALAFYFLPPWLGFPSLDSDHIGLIGTFFPLAVAVAILRHNLFDIDTLLNRTLVYGGLTAVTMVLYIFIVTMLGTLFQAQGNLWITFIATGFVAILFQPLRARLQQGINHLMYGRRDEPFEVVAQLGRRLESTLASDTVYQTIVETVAQALKLPYVAIAVMQENELVTAVSYGKPDANLVTYPLTYQGEILGELIVAQRAADEAFGAADERLLRNIARQAGTAVHTVQLTLDLQRSRRQLVNSREEERRRLRRDLHDGLGPSLAAQMLKLGAARALLAEQPAATVKLLLEMESDLAMTLTEVRRIVYNLRPPELDQLGLVGALQAFAEEFEQGSHSQDHLPLQINLTMPSPLPPLPAAVEVALYRIAQEGLTNVVRHAQARRCEICLCVETMENGPEDGRVSLTIYDDGVGLPAPLAAGVGLQAMRERAMELGGICQIESENGKGTWITAVLPFLESSN